MSVLDSNKVGSISDAQLQLYKAITDQIKREEEKHDSVRKQIEEETNNIIVLRLAADQTSLSNHLFRVSVKVFDSFAEAVDLYGHNALKWSPDLTGGSVFLIEVYIADMLREKITQKWMINVCLRYEFKCVYKNAFLTKENPVRLLMPAESVKDVVVETRLVNPQGWISLDVDRTVVDVSYSFKSTEIETPKDVLFEIAGLYNKRLQKSPKLEYKVHCDCSEKHLLETVLKNCYHRLDANQLNSLVGNSAVNEIKLACGDDEAKLCFDKTSKMLTILATPEDLYSIKLYLVDSLRCETVTFDMNLLAKLEILRKYVVTESLKSKKNLGAIKTIYEEFKNITSLLPL